MTEELNTKKRVRGGHRSSVKRLESKAKEIFNEIDTNASTIQENVATLTQVKMSLQAKLTTLHNLDQEILTFTEDEELDNEIEQADLCTERVHQIIVEIDLALSEHTTKTPLVSTSNSTNDGSSTSKPGKQVEITAKLPKLQMKLFNGKPTDWQPFIDCFDSAIHSNTSLSDIDKMNYLKSLLEGPALAAINGLSLSSANYKSARDILQQRYGNKQLLISSHMDELITLPQVNSVGDIKGIRQLYDKTEINLRGLQNLGIESKQYGTLLIPILLNKLPQELRLIISRKFESSDGWELDELLKVFKAEVEARERCSLLSCSSNTKVEKRHQYSKPPISAAALLSPGPEVQKITCTFCNGSHKTVDCSVVTSVDERKTIVRRQGRCFNCLRRNHVVSACNNKRNCTKCSRRHHTSLCPQLQEQGEASTCKDKDPVGSAKPSVSMYVDTKTSILLQTCIAQASNPGQQPPQNQLVRILLDSGSQRTYITQQLKERLNLKTITREKLCIKTFGEQCDKVQTVEVVNLCLKNANSKENLVITAHVVPMICSPLCNQEVKIAKNNYHHLADLTLSESACVAGQSLEVHVLIGSDNYWNVVNGEVRRGDGGPVAMNTKFGWTISGPVRNIPHTSTHSVNLASTHVLKVGTSPSKCDCDQELTNKLDQFWKLESIGINTNADPVVELFNDNIVYHNMRYEVALPWKEVHDPLPDNFTVSLRRLKSLLQRLKPKEDQLREYDNVIKDQLDKGIIERVNSEGDEDNTHYLPHHCVVREDKQTTKLRIVYDASAKQDGPSLNDCLYTGPSLSPDIFDILLRFRIKPIAVIADIEKAFLMISIKESDRDVLRFLWVDDPFSADPQMVTYRFTRVVFGVTCSPFLLNATLKKHITEYEREDPKFAELMLCSLYVDDLTVSVEDVETAYQLFLNARNRMTTGGFNLRKWLTNSTELMKRIAEESISSEANLSSNNQTHCTEDDETFNRVTSGGLEERDGSTEQKVLGTNWNFVDDEIIFKFQKHVDTAGTLEPTRRNVLRVVAGFYDPMGLISPVIVQMKILLQEVCKQDTPWDAPLIPELKAKWTRLIKELNIVNVIQIPRCVNLLPQNKECHYELEGFSDASMLAYAAVVYLVVKSEETVQVKLLNTRRTLKETDNS